MSSDGCVALPRGAMGLSAVVIVVFPDHTHLLPFLINLKLISELVSSGASFLLFKCNISMGCMANSVPVSSVTSLVYMNIKLHLKLHSL